MRRTRNYRPILIETQEQIDRLEAMNLREPMPDHSRFGAILLICVVVLLMISATLFLFKDIQI